MADTDKTPTPTPAAASTPAQAIKAANDALIAGHETKMTALKPEERAAYFFNNKDADSLKLVNLLSQAVDAIRNPADRKAFFLAHPELEVRYSFRNFLK